MNINQEVRTVRLSLIITVVASTAGLMVLFTPFSYDDSGITIMSSFGEITIFDPKQPPFLENNMYHNSELSFQLSKPNDKWDIRVASETIRAEELAYLKSKGYVDGIYLDKDSDRRFLVSVFDVQSKNFQLENYISKQINMMDSKEDIKIPIKRISKSNDWAIVSFDNENNTDDSFSEQLLFLKDNRLYMLQYSGKSPENLTTIEKSDFNSVLNSFEVI